MMKCYSERGEDEDEDDNFKRIEIIVAVEKDSLLWSTAWLRQDLLWEGCGFQNMIYHSLSFFWDHRKTSSLLSDTRASWKFTERDRDNAFDTTKGTVEGQRDEDLDAVSSAGDRGVDVGRRDC